MNKPGPSPMYTLVKRELQEYRISLLITPLVIAATLIVVMLASILLADRISFMGEMMINSIVESRGSGDMRITIQIDEEGTDISQQYRIREQADPLPEEEWDFSREWDFDPGTTPDTAKPENDGEREEGSLNTIFNMLHSFMVLVLVAVTANYLLGCLFNDRKDRSILFWKSMPTSDWQQVGAKLLVALVAAPAIYIAVSLIMQLVTTSLAMVLVWRLDGDPAETVLANIEVLPLLVNPLASWTIAALWIAPLYAWLMLASAGAKRSPFMLAVAPVLALVVLEQMLMGSEFFATAVSAHLPHYVDSSEAVTFYFSGSEWTHIDVVKIAGGLLFAGAAIWATVWLRRYRFEL